jgi:hypothetical protein
MNNATMAEQLREWVIALDDGGSHSLSAMRGVIAGMKDVAADLEREEAEPAPTTQVYQVQSTPLIHTPGVFRWAMAMDHRSHNKQAKTEAARLYLLASLIPHVPGAALLDIAQGKLVPVVDGDMLVITVKKET